MTRVFECTCICMYIYISCFELLITPDNKIPVVIHKTLFIFFHVFIFSTFYSYIIGISKTDTILVYTLMKKYHIKNTLVHHVTDYR